jgi:hypothetical protein
VIAALSVPSVTFNVPHCIPPDHERATKRAASSSSI